MDRVISTAEKVLYWLQVFFLIVFFSILSDGSMKEEDNGVDGDREEQEKTRTRRMRIRIRKGTIIGMRIWREQQNDKEKRRKG